MDTHPIPRRLQRGLRELAARCPDLGRIEAEAGKLPWRVRTTGYAGLLQAIVGQQISNQAAAAIWRRVQAVPGALDPAGLLALDEDTLRAAGLSRPKVAHARALATAYAQGVLDDAALAEMEDEAAIETISSVRGLGRWTAEIHLLFSLERPDVFPAADLALAASLAHLRGLEARPKPAELRKLAEEWAPWRGLAARLLWHWWRHATGRPSMDDLGGGKRG